MCIPVVWDPFCDVWKYQHPVFNWLPLLTNEDRTASNEEILDSVKISMLYEGSLLDVDSILVI